MTNSEYANPFDQFDPRDETAAPSSPGEPAPLAPEALRPGQMAVPFDADSTIARVQAEDHINRNVEIDNARDASASGLFGQWNTLKNDERKASIADARSAGQSQESWWQGVHEHVIGGLKSVNKAFAKAAGVDDDAFDGSDPATRFLERKTEEMIALGKRRQFIADQMDANEAEAAKIGVTRNVVEQVGRGLGEGLGFVIGGSGRLANYATDALAGAQSEGEPDRRLFGNALQATGKWIAAKAEEYFPGDEARQYEWSGKIANGAGSMAAFLGPSLAVSVLTRAGPKTLAAMAEELGSMDAAVALANTQAARVAVATSAGLGAPMEAESMAQDAERAMERGVLKADGTPVTADDVRHAFMWGLPIGMTEALSIPHLLKGLGASTLVKETFRQMAEEGGQEWVQTVLENVTAQNYYDPERKWDDNAWEAAAIGSVLGGGMEIATHLKTKTADGASKVKDNVNGVQEARLRTNGTVNDVEPTASGPGAARSPTVGAPVALPAQGSEGPRKVATPLKNALAWPEDDDLEAGLEAVAGMVDTPSSDQSLSRRAESDPELADFDSLIGKSVPDSADDSGSSSYVERLSQALAGPVAQQSSGSAQQFGESAQDSIQATGEFGSNDGAVTGTEGQVEVPSIDDVASALNEAATAYRSLEVGSELPAKRSAAAVLRKSEQALTALRDSFPAPSSIDDPNNATYRAIGDLGNLIVRDGHNLNDPAVQSKLSQIKDAINRVSKAPVEPQDDGEAAFEAVTRGKPARPAAAPDATPTGPATASTEADSKITAELKQKFRDVLRGDKPSKYWAKTTGATPEQMKALLKDAKRQGLIRKAPGGAIRRTPLAKQADVIKPGKAAAAKTKKIATPQDILGTPENLAVREAAAREIFRSPEALGASLLSGLRTDLQPGFMTPEWKQSREYVAGDGSIIKGYDAVVAHLAAKLEAKVPGGLRFEKQAVMVIGFPGAGKGTVSAAISAFKGAAHITCDDAKELIPEYDRGFNAAGVHEESAVIAADVVGRFLDRNANFIFEKVGSSDTSIAGPLSKFRQLGYHTDLVHVDVPKAVAMERAISRYRRMGRLTALPYYELKIGEIYDLLKKEGVADETSKIDWKEIEPAGWVTVEAGQSLAGLTVANRAPGKPASLGQPGMGEPGRERRFEPDAGQADDGQSLSILPELRVDRQIRQREDKIGQALPDHIIAYATRLEVARGDDEAFMPVLAEIRQDKRVTKALALELAHIVGVEPKRSTTKAQALASIEARHKDFLSSRASALEAINADRSILEQSQGDVSEAGVPGRDQALGEDGLPRGASESDRAGSRGAVRPDSGRDENGGDNAGGLRAAPERPSGDPGTGQGNRQSRADLRAARAQQRKDLEDSIAADREAESKSREDRARSNYQITQDDKIGQGGAKAKVKGNLEALRTLAKIETENRTATDEEKKILVKYVGWGAFAQDVFAEHKPEWAKERAALADLMSPDEFRAARASTLNAHYTSEEVINGMWGALTHLGFTGGRALEPAAGIGHFIGLQPKALRSATDWSAVELDTVSGRLTKALYGAADVRVQGFETVEWPDGFFDLAMSNVPFGNFNLEDKSRKGFLIHDYFFVKALDKIRPGGVVAFITSAGTLDKPNARARRAMAQKATFLGAIRLPGGSKGAFKANSGTDVTTDIVFLRKRVDGEPIGDQTWLGLKEVKTPEGPTEINAYFADNPEMMLGKMRLTGSMYRADMPVLIGSSENLGEKIIEAAKAGLPADAMLPRSVTSAELVADIDTETLGKPGALYQKGGKTYRIEGGVGVAQKVNAADAKKIAQFIGLRDTVNEMLAGQSSGKDGFDGTALRDKLNKQYDAFVAEHGPINKTVVTTQVRKSKDLLEADKEVTIRRYPNFSAFEDDPDSYKVAAIEVYDPKTGTARKAAIFSQDILAAYERPTISGPGDALAVSLNENGKIDIPFIANQLGMTQAEAIKSLGDKIYLDPTGDLWVPAEQYLAGDVVQRLEDARAAAETDAKYQRNVAALEKAQPEQRTRFDIRVNMGAPWIPADVYQEFIHEQLGVRNADLQLNKATQKWQLVNDPYFPPSAQAKFATERVTVKRVLEAAMNSTQITVYDRDKDDKPIHNPAAEADAQARVTALRDLFNGNPRQGIESWLWANEGQAARLEPLYNYALNRLAPEKYDGSHLTFPGLARVVTFADGTTDTINLPPHRTSAVWRIIRQGNSLLGHAVGSGKTWTAIMSGMEQKRLGLIQRPAYVVPNHMLEQFSNEFLQAYPNAKLLIASKDEMTVKKRKEFVARAAADKWDGIIITHDAFGRISMSDQAYNDFYQEQIEELETIIAEQTANSNARSPTVKETVRRKKSLQNKLDKLLNKDRKDDGTTFEEMGVDFLYVDESHFFKNLSFNTQHTRVKGISNASESQRATDLFVKIRHLERARPGRSAVFMSGTPVSNTMVEFYNIQRYLQLDELKKYGIEQFDAWANTFGQMSQDVERTVSGTFKSVTSFSRFINIPELMAIISRVADFQTADMLNLPRPKLEGGKIGVVEAEASQAELEYMQSLVTRAEKLKTEKIDPTIDNMLKIVSEGRKVATDMRLLDQSSPFNPNGKIGKAVDKIYDIWKDGTDPALVQMVFLDMGVPGSKGGAKAAKPGKSADSVVSPIEAIRREMTATATGEDTSIDSESEADTESDEMFAGLFNLYEEIRTRLVMKGVPKEQIAFIHEAKGDDGKERMFEDVRNGKIRVFIGSTAKMGVGTNVQKRLKAIHHIDAPWKPAEVEQRDGRILRQGNKNAEIQIWRYVTKNSFDAYMWQILERKAKFIGQLLAGSRGVRDMEDIDNPLPEAAALKAAASGDPRVLEHATLAKEINDLEIARRAHIRAAQTAKASIAVTERQITDTTKYLAQYTADAAKVQDLSGESFAVTLTTGQKPVTYKDRKKAGEQARDYILRVAASIWGGGTRTIELGQMSNFDMAVETKRTDIGFEITPILKGTADYRSYDSALISADTNPVALVQRFERVLKQVSGLRAATGIALTKAQADLPRLQKAATETRFAKQAEIDAKTARRVDLEASINAPTNADAVLPSETGRTIAEGKISPADFAKSVADLKERLGVETIPLEDDAPSPDAMASLLSYSTQVKRAFETPGKGSKLALVKQTLGSLQKDATDTIAVAAKTSTVDIDGATLPELKTFQRALNDLSQILNKKIDAGYKVQDTVEGLGDKISKTIENFSVAFESLGDDIGDVLNSLSEAHDAVVEAYPEMFPEMAEDYEDPDAGLDTATGLAIKDYSSPFPQAYPDNYSLLDIISEELGVSKDILLEVEREAEDFLGSFDIDRVTADQAREIVDRISAFMDQISPAASSARYFGNEALTYIETAVNQIDEIIETVVKPTIEQLETAAQEVSDKLDEVSDMLDDTSPDAMAALIGYHGSAHDFDKLKADKSRGGVLGYGIYISDKQATAAGFKGFHSGNTYDVTSGFSVWLKKEPAKSSDPAHAAAIAVAEAGSREKAIANLTASKDDPSEAAALAVLRGGQKLPTLTPGSGRLYQVSVDAELDQFMEFHAPLAQQPKAVQVVLREQIANIDSVASLSDAIRANLKRSDSPLREALKKTGVPGVKMSASEDTTYVIFDEDRIKITHKDGAPVSSTERGVVMASLVGSLSLENSSLAKLGPMTPRFKALAPEVVSAIEAEIRQALPPGIGVRLADRLFVHGFPARGIADIEKRLLSVSLASGAGMARETGRHEIVHILRSYQGRDILGGLYTADEWATLLARAKKLNIGRSIQVETDTASTGLGVYRQVYTKSARESGYRGAMLDAKVDEMLNQELVAKMAETWADGATYGTAIDKLLYRITEFMDAIARALRSLGFDVPSDVFGTESDAAFRKSFSGEIAARAALRSWMEGHDINVMAASPYGPMFAFAGRMGAENLKKQGVSGPSDALDLAASMKASGHTPKEIFETTSDLLRGTPYAGVHFGRDGKARFEISDANNELLAPGKWGKTHKDGGLTVDLGEPSKRLFSRREYWDVEQKGLQGPHVNHPELLKAYPEMADRTISLDVDWKNKERGAGVTRGGDIRVFALHDEPDFLRSALAHELDHVISGIEGFSPGGNPEMMKGHALYRKPHKMAAALDQFIGIPPPEHLLYQRLAGETQARNTQARLDMPPEVRRTVAPWQTQDKPFHNQVERPTTVQSWVNPYLPGEIKLGMSQEAKDREALYAKRNETPTPDEPFKYKPDGGTGWEGPVLPHPNQSSGAVQDLSIANSVVMLDGRAAKVSDFKSVWIRQGGLDDMAYTTGASARDYIQMHVNLFRNNSDKPIHADGDYQAAMKELVDLEKAGRLHIIPLAAYRDLEKMEIFPAIQGPKNTSGAAIPLASLIGGNAAGRPSSYGLGFYSKLDEVLDGLSPNDTVTAETLRKRGIKNAEMQVRGVSELLADGKGAKVADLAAAASPVEVREVNYGAKTTADVERDFDDAFNELEASGVEPGRAQQFLGQSLGYGRWENPTFEDEAKRYLPPALVQRGMEIAQRLFKSEKNTRWSQYSIDPSNPTYRETVLHLPEIQSLAATELNRYNELGERYARGSARRQMTPAERQEYEALEVKLENQPTVGGRDNPNFISGHFSEPNIIAHVRTTMQADAQGRDVFTINELQSDWGQQLRDGGVIDPEKIAKIKGDIGAALAWHNQLKADAEKLFIDHHYLRSMVGLEPKVLQGTDLRNWMRLHNYGVQATNFERAYNDLRRLEAELISSDQHSKVIGHPLINTTDQWVDTAMKRMIAQAVEAGADSIAIVSGDTVISFDMGGEAEGLHYAYDKMYPKNLRNILRKLDASIEPSHVATLDAPGGKTGLGKGFTVFPLTDKIREEVQGRGMPLFSLIGGSSRDSLRTDLEDMISHELGQHGQSTSSGRGDEHGPEVSEQSSAAANGDAGSQSPRARRKIDPALKARALTGLIGDYYSDAAVTQRRVSQGFTQKAWHATNVPLFDNPDPFVANATFGFHVAIGSQKAANSRIGYPQTLNEKLISLIDKLFPSDPVMPKPKDGGKIIPLWINPGKTLNLRHIVAVDGGTLNGWANPIAWRNVLAQSKEAPAELIAFVEIWIAQNPDVAKQAPIDRQHAFSKAIGAELTRLGYGSIAYTNEVQSAGEKSLMVWEPNRVRSSVDLFHESAIGKPGFEASAEVVFDEARQALNDFAAELGHGSDVFASLIGAKGAANLAKHNPAAQKAIDMAEAMERDGQSRNAIWYETADYLEANDPALIGVYRGIDGKWRVELDDDALQARFGKGKGMGSGWLSRPLVSHAVWEKAYPKAAKHTRFEITNNDEYASEAGYTPNLDKIEVNVGRQGEYFVPSLRPEREIKGSLVHEMQHVAQREEGFVSGGNPNQASESDVLQEVKVLGLDPKSALAMVEARMSIYTRLAGEVEARNVTSRAAMTIEERRDTPPWETEDTPSEDQILKFNKTGVSKSLPLPTNVQSELSDLAGKLDSGAPPNLSRTSTGTKPGPIVALSEIIADLKTALRMPATQGRYGLTVFDQSTGSENNRPPRSWRFRPQSNLRGQYHRLTGVARYRLSTDIEAVAHEGGHHLESLFGHPLELLKRGHAAELRSYAYRSFTPAATDTARSTAPFAYSGYSGLDLDADTQRFIVEYEAAEAQWPVTGNPADRSKAARLRAEVVYRVGEKTAEAIILDVHRYAQAARSLDTLAQYVQERFSETGVPKPPKPQNNLRASLSEGFAEFFREYLLNPDQARTFAPEFLVAFEDFLDANGPDLLQRIERAQLITTSKAYDDYLKATTLDRAMADLVSNADHSWSAKANDALRAVGQANSISGAMSRVYTGAIDENHPWYLGTKALLEQADQNKVVDESGRAISLAVHENPYKLIRSLGDSFKTGLRWIQDGVPNYREQGGKRSASLHDALSLVMGKSWNLDSYQKFGVYLESRRAVEEWKTWITKRRVMADLSYRVEAATAQTSVLRDELRKETAKADTRYRASISNEAVHKDYERALQALISQEASEVEALQVGQTATPGMTPQQMRNARARLSDVRAKINRFEERRNGTLRRSHDIAQAHGQGQARLEQLQAAIDKRGALLERWRGELKDARENGIQRDPHRVGVAEHQARIAEIEKQMPAVKQAALMVYDFVWQSAVHDFQAGRLTKAELDYRATRRHFYVPFARDMSDMVQERGFGGRSSAAKKFSKDKAFTGSDRAIVNPLETIADQTFHRAAATHFNDVMKTFVSLADRVGTGSGAIAERVEQSQILNADSDGFKQIVSRLTAMGYSEEDAKEMVKRIESDFGDTQLLLQWSPEGHGPNRPLMLPLWENGERKLIRLNDPDFAGLVYNSVNGIGRELTDLFTDMLSKPATLLRVGVTTNPAFVIPNVIRDMWSAWILTGNVLDPRTWPLVTQIRGIAHELVQSDMARAYQEVAGIMGGQNVAALSKVRDKADILALKNKGLHLKPLQMTFSTAVGGALGFGLAGPAGAGFGAILGAGLHRGVSEFFPTLALFSDMSETATRMGVFTHAYKAALAYNPSLTPYQAAQEAAYVARDLIDFGRRGSKMLVAARLVPFLNANVQGLDKASRALLARSDRGYGIGPEKIGLAGALGAVGGYAVAGTVAGSVGAFAAPAAAVVLAARSEAARRALAPFSKKMAGIPISADEQKMLAESAKAWVNLMLYSLILVAFAAIYQDDDEYKMISDRVKHRGQPVKLGGEWYQVPKAFEYAIPSNIIEAGINLQFDKDPRFWERVRGTLADNLTPPMLPQAARLWSDIRGNYNSMSGRQIVPEYQKALPPQEQFNAYTSQMAIAISRAVNENEWSKATVEAMGRAAFASQNFEVSPMIIDYALTTGAGYWGKDVQKLSNSTRELGPKSGRVIEYPIIGTVLQRLSVDPYRASDAVKAYYDMLSPVAQGYPRAAAGYDTVLKNRGQAAANAVLATMDEDHRAYALAMGSSDTNARRMHPLNRLESVVDSIRSLEQDLAFGRLADTSAKTDPRPIALGPDKAAEVRDLLAQIKAIEASNTMVALGHEQFAARKMIPVAPILDTLKASSSETADELDLRYRRKHVADFDQAIETWPEIKKDLLETWADLAPTGEAMPNPKKRKGVVLPGMMRLGGPVPPAPVAPPDDDPAAGIGYPTNAADANAVVDQTMVKPPPDTPSNMREIDPRSQPPLPQPPASNVDEARWQEKLM